MGLTGGNALIGQFVDNIDELLKRSGQVPKIGAGTSQPPPANPAPSRFGASALTAPAPAQPALPQAQTVGAPGGTAPFMPAKIGASPQPAMPSSPKIGAGIDTYDPSQSPMPAGGHDYAAEYAAVHDPTPLSPDAGKPSMLRKIGGIAAGAALGAFNPEAGAKIGSSIVNGPRNELMQQYNQQEAQANQQRARIQTESGLAHAGAETQDLQNRPALEAQKEAAAGQREEERLNQQATIETQKETAAGKARQESEAASASRTDKTLAASEQRTQEQISAADRRTDKQISAAEKRAGTKETPFDRENATGASKSVETARGGDFRYRSMAGSLPKAKAGDQQAMLNLLTNHIGMTLGMQKGARITKDILHEAQASTPWLQGLEAKFDSQGYLSGVVLTPQQMDQMMGLAVSQRSNAWAQAIESARQAGVADKVQIPADVRITVADPKGNLFTIPGKQLSQAEDQGYTVAPQ